MKKIKFVITLLLFPVALTGCMERVLEFRTIPPVPERPSVPVRLYTTILSRGMIEAFEGTPVGVVCGSASGNYTEQWEGTATAGEIVLNPQRYYPADGSAIYVRGFYPLAPVDNGCLQYTLTGKEDLMLSIEQSASQDKPFTSAESDLLGYRHLLVQLSFRVSLEGDATSFRVREVNLEGLANNVTFNLSTGKLTSDGVGHLEVFAAPSGSQGLPAVNGEVEIPGYILVQPGAELTLDLALAVDDNPAHDRIYRDLPVTFSDGGGGESGVAYSVNLKVNTLLVAVTATVVPWQLGDGGSGNIKNE